MEKLGQKIWKGIRVMAIDVVRMDGGLVVLWCPDTTCLSDLSANQFSLIANFNFLDPREKGTLVNVYGPSV